MKIRFLYLQLVLLSLVIWGKQMEFLFQTYALTNTFRRDKVQCYLNARQAIQVFNLMGTACRNKDNISKLILQFQFQSCNSNKLLEAARQEDSDVERNENGNYKIFSKLHDLEFLELAKKIWGAEDDMANACPVCLGICNCKSSCTIERLEKFKLGSVPPAGVQIENSRCLADKCMLFDNCRTSIFDYNRSCSNCSSDLCLVCCWEICVVHLQGGGPDVVIEYVDRGFDYLHGVQGKRKCELPTDLPKKTGSVGFMGLKSG
ncbi:unnamed protein product [Dovyalis caffra]|uniref:Uncharacterized protein n=1 Tax=Dovyalis caffra TaxID=77055 RepID=A0AAV1RZV0_9ROSI|nr:unnamed protein product [Dovyalis caffra]